MQTEIDRLVGGLLRIGGRARGDETRLLWPRDEGTVRPESFLIRWTPRPAGEELSLALHDAETEKPLWEASHVPGSTGRLAAREARRALLRWRDRHGGGRDKAGVTLIFDSPAIPRTRILFAVLSRAEERTLQAELGFWQSQARGLMRHLGRGEVFHRWRLLAESAAEYERALDLAPNDAAVRHRAAEANWMIDDRARATQIEPEAERSPD
jgi:hypothetical protein